MLTRLLTSHRRPTTDPLDERRPAPLPRMRWY
jgi:hypothetical protein